ncbi:hypothetical protein [Clostridium psychrophilum]|nr:hypothetical protein [Clostridium psychrophilum]MBU3180314.1 hypothetical protein [Clostridium psychrophilum]
MVQSANTFLIFLLLYPTIRTDRKIGLRYTEVKNIIGENFDLYFNCKEK